MYRALAYLALSTGTDVDNGTALVHLLRVAPVEVILDESAPLGFRVFEDERELDEATLQSNEVTAIVSSVAAHAQVRAAMVEAQRRVAAKGPVVMAGRDIGTVVLPNAQVKIYLTASVAARVARRRSSSRPRASTSTSHRLAEEIEERDRLDRSRAVSPLAPAPDAHVIDSSEIDARRVVDEICAIVARAANRRMPDELRVLRFCQGLRAPLRPRGLARARLRHRERTGARAADRRLQSHLVPRPARNGLSLPASPQLYGEEGALRYSGARPDDSRRWAPTPSTATAARRPRSSARWRSCRRAARSGSSPRVRATATATVEPQTGVALLASLAKRTGRSGVYPRHG